MNKHTIIVIIASIVIIAPFAIFGLSVAAAEELQIRWSEPEKFGFFPLSNNGQVVICNPSPFLLDFVKLEIHPFYEGKHYGTFTVDGDVISPHSSSNFDGIYRSERFAESQYLYMNMDGQFGGTESIRVDPRFMSVTTQIQIPLLGFIPFTIEKQESGFDFYNMMKADLENFDC